MFISNTSCPFHCIQVVVALLLDAAALVVVVALLLVGDAELVVTCAAALAGTSCTVRHVLCHIVRIST